MTAETSFSVASRVNEFTAQASANAMHPGSNRPVQKTNMGASLALP